MILVYKKKLKPFNIITGGNDPSLLAHCIFLPKHNDPFESLGLKPLVLKKTKFYKEKKF